MNGRKKDLLNLSELVDSLKEIEDDQHLCQQQSGEDEPDYGK